MFGKKRKGQKRENIFQKIGKGYKRGRRRRGKRRQDRAIRKYNKRDAELKKQGKSKMYRRLVLGENPEEYFKKHPEKRITQETINNV